MSGLKFAQVQDHELAWLDGMVVVESGVASVPVIDVVPNQVRGRGESSMTRNRTNERKREREREKKRTNERKKERKRERLSVYVCACACVLKEHVLFFLSIYIYVFL